MPAFTTAFLSTLAAKLSEEHLIVGRKLNFGFGVFLICLLLSNIFISIISPWIGEVYYLFLSALDILIFSFIALIVLLMRGGKVSFITVTYLLLIFFYYLIGFFAIGPIQSTIYLRFLLYPFLGLLILKNHQKFEFDKSLLINFLAAIFIAILFFEMVFTEHFFRVFNVLSFMDLKGRDVATIEELLVQSHRRIFNFEIFEQYRIYRPWGVILHPISSAYVAAFFTIYYFIKNKFIISVFFVFATILFMAKGPFIALIISLFSALLYKNSKIFTLPVFLILAVLTSIVSIGWVVRNPHIVSLIYSFSYLGENLLGEGIGFAGALTLEGDEVTSSGLKGESVLALMITGMGVVGVLAIFLLLIDYVRFFSKVSYLVFTSYGVVFWYFVLVMGNSIFQEEAFSPYAIILAVMLSLIAIKNNQSLAANSECNT
ncbi:hypothetical protein FGL86_11245 [Pistricoccus aurantiacus]|uniref:Oligosaccharide repeat unit polymerase n=1 Tax=Pistricoccus aurantiacus TaxID=1883414 RepID=A0A5B8STE7_9GAMM|nr:hypothetical protein [Pistricoccus aurantiacus]QEA39594.1 hypothetical protein FGL86_11245 [Pistricoccus aurantiacus]